jgi:hypothetical protein
MAPVEWQVFSSLNWSNWKSPCRLRNCPVRGRLEMTGMGSWRDSGEWQVFSSLNCSHFLISEIWAGHWAWEMALDA